MKRADRLVAVFATLLVVTTFAPADALAGQGAPTSDAPGSLAADRDEPVAVAGHRTPDPVTFVPQADPAGRARRPEATLGFASRGERPTGLAPDSTGMPDRVDPNSVVGTDATVTLDGRIVTPEGAPIDGSSIYIRDANGTALSSDTTAADGAFSTTVAAGTYAIQVVGGTGFASGWFGTDGFGYESGAAGTLDLPTDATTEIIVPPLVRIAGKVTASGVARAGVEVDVFRDGIAFATTTTASDGAYAIAVLPGAYLLGFYDPSATYAHGFLGASGFTADPAAGKVIAVATTNVTGANISLPTARRIAGKVVDVFGTGRGSVYVEAWVNGVYYSSGSTTSSGAFSLPVASGGVKLWIFHGDGVVAPGWRTATSLTSNVASALTTTVGSASVSGIVIHAPDAAFITGHVFFSSAPGSQGAFSDMWVEAVAYGQATSFALTTGYGEFTMPVLAGTYRVWSDSHTVPGGANMFGGVWYRSPGAATADYSLATPITVSSGGHRSATIFTPFARWMSGRATDDFGIALSHYDVQFWSGGHLYRDSVINGGAFSLSVAPGTYRLAFVDLYGLYQPGWLGASGYVEDYASALDVVVTAENNPDGLAIRLPMTDPPAAPSSVAATPFHSGAWVSWIGPATTPERPIIHATVTASPGGRTCTAAGSSGCLVTGLVDGTPYTFTVTATSTAGSSDPSAASGAVTPLPVPDAPADVTAVPSGSTLVVSWTAAADNGDAVTSYAVTSLPGGSTCVPQPANATTCTIAGLADGRYAVTVDATNGHGRGPAGSSGLVTVDVSGPVVGTPATTLRSGLSVTGTAVPVSVAWTATDVLSDVAASEVDLQIGTGAYVAQSLSSPTSRVLYRTLTSSASTYRFRVRAADGVGNVSAYTVGSPTTVTLRQEATTGIAYGGTWTTASLASASGGRLRYTGSKGAYVSLTFTGRSVAWVTRKGSTSGRAAVYLDGKLVATIDLRSTTSVSRWIAHSATFSASAKHTLKIVNLATSGRPRIDIDAFITMR